MRSIRRFVKSGLTSSVPKLFAALVPKPRANLERTDYVYVTFDLGSARH